MNLLDWWCFWRDMAFWWAWPKPKQSAKVLKFERKGQASIPE